MLRSIVVCFHYFVIGLGMYRVVPAIGNLHLVQPEFMVDHSGLVELKAKRHWAYCVRIMKREAGIEASENPPGDCYSVYSNSPCNLDHHLSLLSV